MQDVLYNLSSILDIPKWEPLQDQMSLITKMGIITIDYKGIPITKHSNCCAFCRSVRADPQLEKYCQLCDSRAGLEAVRSQQPYVYLCHFGIIDIAIPITIDDKYIGAIMAGQVKLTDPTGSPFEKILSAKNLHAAQHLQRHRDEYDAIVKLPAEELGRCVQVLASLSSYIVETSLAKNKIIHSYEQFCKGLHLVSDRQTAPPVAPGLSREYLDFSNRTPGAGDSVLTPAFDYIEKHPLDPITQAQMAALCHISAGYFSRLFSQKAGEPFSQYLTRKKIEQGKVLLKTTSWSVGKISDELNFNSPGYFIKVFKKFEGVTPLMYKKYYCGDP